MVKPSRRWSDYRYRATGSAIVALSFFAGDLVPPGAGRSVVSIVSLPLAVLGAFLVMRPGFQPDRLRETRQPPAAGPPSSDGAGIVDQRHGWSDAQHVEERPRSDLKAIGVLHVFVLCVVCLSVFGGLALSGRIGVVPFLIGVLTIVVINVGGKKYLDERGEGARTRRRRQ